MSLPLKFGTKLNFARLVLKSEDKYRNLNILDLFLDFEDKDDLFIRLFKFLSMRTQKEKENLLVTNIYLWKFEKDTILTNAHVATDETDSIFFCKAAFSHSTIQIIFWK